jgi:hypothetical protein
MRGIRRNLTYANVMVTLLAVLVVGGSGAYAATKLKLKNNSVTSAKIRDGEVMNADLAGSAVNSARIEDGSVAPADVADALLGDRSVGRSVAGGSCNPPPLVECRGLDLTLPRAARVLVLADAAAGGSGNDAMAAGACQITIDGTATAPGVEVTLFASPGIYYETGINLSQVTGPLAAGQHHFGVICSETDVDVIFTDFHVSAVSLSAE